MISSLTTAESTTTASPDGTFILDQSLLPLRARRGGAWVPLDATLHAGQGGTVSPSVTTDDVTLSGGGTRPLAVMTDTGHTMSLNWPGPLPKPSLSGGTATYANVLPGVDLQVTVSNQGAISTMLVVRNATAAANPALGSLHFTTATPGLRLAAIPGGGLSVTAGPKATPVFSVAAPRMWDSAGPPAQTAIKATPGGTAVAASSGMPAYSSAAAPGAFAHVTAVPLTASGHTITMAPPAAALTGHRTVYPLYIDPTIYSDPIGAGAAAWAQVDSAWPSQTYWKLSSDLQVGLCDWTANFTCGQNSDGTAATFKARSFIRMPINSNLTGATINYSHLFMTNVWAPSCTAEAVQLWTTGGISSSTDWSNQPSWDSQVQSESFAHGYNSTCGYKADNVTWNITSTVQGDVKPASSYKSTQVFGLRAASESDDLYWKQFWDGTHNNIASIHMTTSYNLPPNAPASLATNPGGACQTSQSSAAQIGNDEVTFSASVLDQDGDSSLSTRFVIYNSGGTVAYDSATGGSDVGTGNNTTASLPLSRTVMRGLNGTSSQNQAYTYYWQAQTTDTQSSGSSLTGGWSSKCWFIYNPLGPSSPVVSPDPGSGQIGQSFTASFSPAQSGCGGATTPPCPASYTYQLGASRPVTVTADSSGNWSGTIPIHRIGPMLLAVYATDSTGNLSRAATVTITGTQPATSYADGDLNGDGQPDLLTTGTGANPGLWLSPGTGPGTLSRPVDIGGPGTGINSNGSPSDWAGAQVLHGDFTGRGVQDIMAYYPTGTNAGDGQLIDGTGDGGMLAVNANTAVNIPPASPAGPGALYDPTFANQADVPIDLVAAGNANETGTGNTDLIGILGDGTNGYELNLYTTTPGSTGAYGYETTLSTTTDPPPGASADPSSDWSKYQLVTVQLPDSAYPGGDPANAALFALDTVNGDLYESTNTGCGTTAGCASGTLIGSPGTWQQLTVPWTSPPSLASADINASGQTELWASDGTTDTAYTLAGTALSQENSGTLTRPAHQWPIAEGTGTTAADTTGTLNAALSGTSTSSTWSPASAPAPFAPALNFDGSTNALATSSAAIQPAQDFTVSAWVNPAALGGTVLSQDMTQAASFKIYTDATAGTWNFCMATSDTASAGYNCVSGGQAAPGIWTQVKATYQASPGVMNFYIGGTEVASTTHTALSGVTNGDFQVGDALTSGQHGGYFKGAIADVQTWNQVMGPAPSADPSYYQPITPTRILDTRDGTGGINGPVAANTAITLPITGTGSIPAANVTAVAVNITVTTETSTGHIDAYPGSTPHPVTSTLDYATGTATANLAVVPVGPDGAIDLRNSSGGTTQLIADVFGYFTSDRTLAGDTSYTPMPAATRILDTRNGTGAPQAPITAGSTLSVQIGGTHGIPASAAAVAINLTAVNQTTSGYLTAYADGTTKPTISNLQFSATNPAAEMAFVPIGTDGKIDIYAGSATTDVIGDVSGYFTPGTSGYKYHAIGATRIIDTRQNGNPIAADGTLTINLGALLPIPGNATITNLTAVNPTSSGYLNAFTTGTTEPATSSINYGTGQTTANIVLPPTSTSGTISITNHSSGTVDIILDTMGYFSPQ